MDKSINVTLRSRIEGESINTATYVGELGRITVPITDKAYASLMEPDATEPMPRPDLPKGEWVWESAGFGGPKFDTEDGILHAGDFVVSDSPEKPAFLVTDEGSIKLIRHDKYEVGKDSNVVAMDAAIVDAKPVDRPVSVKR